MTRTYAIGDMLNRRYRVEYLLSTDGAMSQILKAKDKLAQLKDTTDPSIEVANPRYDSIVLVKQADYSGFIDPAEAPDERERTRKSLQNSFDLEILATTENKRGSPNFVENLVMGFDSFQIGDDSYLVMEFLEGKTLEKVIQELTTLPGSNRPHTQVSSVSEYQGVKIAFEMAAVLEYLHQFQGGLIHRDIKPSNVMLSPNGNLTDCVKVYDLGISEKKKKSNKTMLLGIAAGSPFFAAPEQYAPNGAIPKSDVYSLGAVLLYTLLGNNHPMDPVDITASEPLKPYIGKLAVVRKNLSHRVLEMIQKMTLKDISMRWDSTMAREYLGQHLQHLKASESQSAHLEYLAVSEHLGINHKPVADPHQRYMQMAKNLGIY